MTKQGLQKMVLVAVATVTLFLAGCCCPRSQNIQTGEDSGGLEDETNLVYTEYKVLSLSTNPPPGPPIGGPGGSDSCCPSYCGVINFNNGGSGYTVYANQPFTIKLSQSPTMTPLIPAANYCARWRYGGQSNQTGCFWVYSTYEQRFYAPVTSQYLVTVYIKNNCPPNGTPYYISFATPVP